MVKSEEWNNEFVDIGSNPIPDRAVVRVVEAVSIETIIMLTRTLESAYPVRSCFSHESS